jgi:hypothetical protein
VCRAWRAAAAHPSLWEELSFKHCVVRVNDAALATLCARSGAALRTLLLNGGTCRRVTAAGMVAALRDGACTGVQRLCAALSDPPGFPPWWQFSFRLNHDMVQQLVAACPMLRYAPCALDCKLSDAAVLIEKLPGPLSLCFEEADSDDAVLQLVSCLRSNTTLADLQLSMIYIGDVVAMQLADCLRVNTTLTNLDLADNRIGVAGATQLAQCLRINTTLRWLNLYINEIGTTGATRLLQCLRNNTTLTSLNIGSNHANGDKVVLELVKCLHVNQTLTSLALGDSDIGVAGAAQLAECLRVNATLTTLDLSENHIGDVGPALDHRRPMRRRAVG